MLTEEDKITIREIVSEELLKAKEAEVNAEMAVKRYKEGYNIE